MTQRVKGAALRDGLRLAAIAVFVLVVLAAAAKSVEPGPAKYRRVGPGPMPQTVVFRGCSGYEDEMAHLKLTVFEPERVVYRCMQRGY